jgi:hypothetical protein
MGLLTLAPSTFNPPVSATLGGSVVLDVNGSNTIGGSLSATTTLTNAGIIRLNPTGVATTTLGATNIVNGTGAVLVSNASTSGLVLNGNSTFTGGAFSLTAGTITGTSTLSNASIALGPINVLLPGTNPANALVPLTAESLAPFIASGAITELNAANLLQAIPLPLGIEEDCREGGQFVRKISRSASRRRRAPAIAVRSASCCSRNAAISAGCT